MERRGRVNFHASVFVSCLLVLALGTGASGQSVKATQEWVALYDGTASQGDNAVEAVVDGSGNVYVTGRSGNALATVKYDAAGNEVWRALYAATATSSGQPVAIALDTAGYVYVAAQSHAGSWDYLLIKYDASGVEQWVQTYDYARGNDNLSDIAVVEVGGKTYLYATGSSEADGSSSASADYATILYDAAGTELWVARYDAGSTDLAQALVVDAAGNAYVTGYTYQPAPASRRYYTTVKYDAAGTEQWVALYGGAAGTHNYAYDIGLDSAGNIVVTGSTATVLYDADGAQQWASPVIPGGARVLATDGAGNTYVTGSTTAKLDATGAQLWTAAATTTIAGRDITVDAGGNVYVTGYSKGDTSVDLNNYDFTTVMYDPDGNEVWAGIYDSGENHWDIAYSIALFLDGTDGNSYVVVTGESQSDQTLSDFATVKYAAASGAEQWAARFDGVASSSAQPNDLTVDASGNVYVTGYTTTSGSATSYATTKYAPDGGELWARVYDFRPAAASSNEANGIVVDGAGGVYVTGSYEDELSDNCGTVKYDAEGALLWEVVYDSGTYDECFDIGSFVDSADGQTYLYVAGRTARSGGYHNLLIKYDAAGVEQWVRTNSYVGADDYTNTPTALVVDAAGNAYIAGSGETVAGYLAATAVGFDKDGEEVWWNAGYTIPNSASDSQFAAMALDSLGNVYATGYGAYRYWIGSQQYTRWDLVTLKYDAAGDEVWSARYGAVDLQESGAAIAVDAAGNVYVGGRVGSGVNNWDTDYLLVKYDADGVEQWVRTFDGGTQNTDRITAVAVDASGTVYVTGQCYSGNTPTYTTIAYDGAGNQLWFERFNGGSGGEGQHEPRGLVVTDDGDVYVSGVSSGATSGADFGTVKYSQALVTSDTVIPQVTAVSPADGATGVTWYPTPVIATFSKSMDPAKLLDPATFTVHDSATRLNVYGTASYDDATRTVQIAGINFQYETTYTATLRAGATDLAGNPIAPLSWSFTIESPPDRTPPTVQSVSPSNGATGVITAPRISATFDEPMSFFYGSSVGFDGTVYDGNFLLVDETTQEQVIPEGVSYDAATYTAAFLLAAPLPPGTSYTATLVGNRVRDASNNLLGADESWTFTTGSDGDTTPPNPPTVFPAPGATDVPVTLEELTATFDEAMAADVFNLPPDIEFTLVETATGTPVIGYPWYMGGTVYLGLTVDALVPATEYTATILGTVADISGNAMGEDFVWSFTTAGSVTPGGDQTPPQVASYTPDGTSLVPPMVGLLTVTFSEGMDPATLEGVSDGTPGGSPFTLRVSGGAHVTGIVVYDAGARTARLVPDVALEYDTTYLVAVGGGATDLAGNPLDSVAPWSFTTSPAPGFLGCDVDAGILEGCVNFDDFTYGTGVVVNTLAIGTTGPVGESALRKKVVDGRAFSTDSYPPVGVESDVESEASAYMDATQIRVEARSRDKVVTTEMDGAMAFAASKIDVVGAPPGTMIPMTVTVTRGGLGATYGPELRIYDFDYTFLGPGVVNFGTTRTFNMLYRAMPNNGIVLYFATGAKKTTSSGGALESNCSATVTFHPPPGVTVTLASGLTFTGDSDSDGDGVADSEDAEPYDASLATVPAATGTGPVEVALDPALGGGVTLSQVQNLDDSNILVNQANKPTDQSFPDGLTSFKVMGLAPGGTATVTITFPTPIPDPSSYYKVGPDGFYPFPPPDVPDAPGATIDYVTNAVTLTLVDGGAGDQDGVANGVIHDPGGLAVPLDCQPEEIWYDGINQSCKAGSDFDQDGDGFELGVDCDDENAAVNPAGVDVCGDGIDQDCWAGDRACPSAAEAHPCDYRPADWVVSLSELLRSIQLFNVGEFHCDPSSEDGYAPGQGDQACASHALDYNPQDWTIGLSELLRAIQFYNSGGYHPDLTTEDGFAPGL